MRIEIREQLELLRDLVRWSGLGIVVGVLAGIGSAAFLHGLNWATSTRLAHPNLLLFLPFAGAAIGLVYARYGREVEGGNNLILERIHSGQGDISWRMAPLIGLSTIGTHLFGGSAGREGTAVQMGGSFADLVARCVRLPRPERRILLMSGISGGFGAVFGTPLAGTVFGLEVLAVGRMRYDALVPCFAASVVGDLVCRALGIEHHPYPIGEVPAATPAMLAWVLLAGIAFGAASLVFAELTHAIHHLMRRATKHAWLRPFAGGLAVIGLTAAVGTRDYLGLGLPLIEASFEPGRVVLWAFAIKIVFTAVTLGTGFKGGEVTPLFCIGATLGAAFARVYGLPEGAFAAFGFTAVFAGAANTPIACILMGIELFGAEPAVLTSLACITSYVVSGHRGIYLSQRVDTPKSHRIELAEGGTLRDARIPPDQASGADRLDPPGASEIPT
ncbi:MAG: voltage-gated chloride channel family protein [Isosphaeraceae bacterium]|nr:voltage-gated chloride channel family protein [Isosphaeraceae bacterium]